MEEALNEAENARKNRDSLRYWLPLCTRVTCTRSAHVRRARSGSRAATRGTPPPTISFGEIAERSKNDLHLALVVSRILALPPPVHRFPPPPRSRSHSLSLSLSLSLCLRLCARLASTPHVRASVVRPSIRPLVRPSIRVIHGVHEDRCNRLYKTATVTSARDILSHASRANGPTGQALYLATISSLSEAKGVVEQKRDTITDFLLGSRRTDERAKVRSSILARRTYSPDRFTRPVPSRPVPFRPVPSRLVPRPFGGKASCPRRRASLPSLSLSLSLSRLLVGINDDAKQIGSVCHDLTMDRWNLLISR